MSPVYVRGGGGAARSRSVERAADGLMKPRTGSYMSDLRNAENREKVCAALATSGVYEIDPKGLGAIRAWLDDMWDGALHSFSAELDKEIEDGEKTNHSD